MEFGKKSGWPWGIRAIPMFRSANIAVTFASVYTHKYSNMYMLYLIL